MALFLDEFCQPPIIKDKQISLGVAGKQFFVAAVSFGDMQLSRGIEFLPFVGIENLPPLSFVDRFLSV
jgi:hypothetical protein